MITKVGVFPEFEADKIILQMLHVTTIKAHETPQIVKITNSESVNRSSSLGFLEKYTGLVVWQGVLSLSLVAKINSTIDILILSIHEAEHILNCSLQSQQSIEDAATKIRSFGVKKVFIKGSVLDAHRWIHDYWSSETHSFWLSQNHDPEADYLKLRNVFSTALVAFLALGYATEDAVILAKMYEHQTLRNSFCYGGFPENQLDIPYLSNAPLFAVPQAFKRTHYLGLYPVVDSLEWVEKLLKLDVKTLQIRIKKPSSSLEDDIKRSIALAKSYQATLFINDYWELALKLGAEALHLGQSDLETADLRAIQQQGLLLGVSTYCYYEVARAHAIAPSYIAIGPIYPTNSKKLDFPAQGIEQLSRWRRTLNYPLVAIGGIDLERTPEVVATGVSGVALISAITQAADPEKATRQLLSLM